MAETVTITIDGEQFQVPKGMNLVDAAKSVDIGIPVFCYHPKMDAVGMCRMCLIEMGSPAINRETGQPEYDVQGEPVIRWMPKLQTACTQLTVDGMYIRTNTQRVVEGRDDILEFLLTSHPLDCPICDKGGECPLQNLTMAYGPGKSRFIFDDKIRLAKRYPLGDLIVLDRERCIQCARCTRFCEEIVGDPVLAFHERGRRLQIITVSDPPFDTVFSGNTTDICPVGALTTTDFRFAARPWELDEVASICLYCPVGCNLSASTRLDRDAGGKKIIKRIMPRQNEAVNEIWICDKGRFGHHHSRAEGRLLEPMIKRNGTWVTIDWGTAYQTIGAKLAEYGQRAGFLAGPSLSNEDLWEMRKLARLTHRESQLGLWPPTMTGLENITQVGVGVGTRLQDLGPETTILVIASDFAEEAPIWWLQVKQAADRGAKVIVANGRKTKLDRYAQATVRYPYGEAAAVLNNFASLARKNGNVAADLVAERVDGYGELEAGIKKIKRIPEEQSSAAEALFSAQNLIVFVGGEGVTLAQHAELMQAAANLLIITGHVARPNNGLVGVWPGANYQGALDMGFSSEAAASLLDNPPALWFIGEADPVAEDTRAAAAVTNAEFVVVAAQFMTPTAEQADLVLPILSFAEREGTFTNGLRRVQRFYMAQTPLAGPLPAWKIFAHIGGGMRGGERPRISAAMVMRDITQHVLRYAEMDYTALARVEPQFPDIGGTDLYYGGTAYENHGGLGIQWATNAEKEKYRLTVRTVTGKAGGKAGGLTVVPVQLLYDCGPLFRASEIMHSHIPSPYAALNPQDAARLGILNLEMVSIQVDELDIEVEARVREDVPTGIVLLPRRLSDTPSPLAPGRCVVQKTKEKV